MDYLALLTDGFAFGLASTAVMTVLQSFYWGRWGLTGVLEWHENQVIWSRVKNSNPSVLSPFGIFSLHFLNGGLAGAPFPLVVAAVPVLGLIPLPALGAVYGVLLWLLTLALIHKSITGVSIINHQQGFAPVAVSLFGHFVYGISLSVLASGML